MYGCDRCREIFIRIRKLNLKALLYVFLGGGVGSVLRYWLSLLSTRFFSVGVFPIGTLLINILGSFLIGYFSGCFVREDYLKYLLITGFCGGFTTFSAFSMENVTLWQSGQIGMALLYVATSVLLGILSVFVGIYLSKG